MSRGFVKVILWHAILTFNTF